MASTPDYLAHIRSESARFAAALAKADPGATVPACPEWDAADLLWHLTEVQLFWAAIVRDRLSDPAAAEAQKPARPTDPAAALALFDQATTALLDALSAAPDDAVIWTWAPEQTAGFVRRWQATEAMIHRIDAEDAAGARTALDRGLAADGVGAVLTYQYGDLPPWGAFDPNGPAGRVEAVDTIDAWPIRVGRFTGTGPESGTVYDMDIARVTDADADAGSPAFTLRGPAAELVTWLFGRGPRDALTVAGDAEAFARFEAIVARGIE
jgi:uncharacterized protein (TIGR03083 family)